MATEEKIKAYKGFNSDMTYWGFHAYMNPLDVLKHPYTDKHGVYNDINRKYCEVELSGHIEHNGEKTIASRIEIKKELSFTEILMAGIEYLTQLASHDDNDTKIGSNNNFVLISTSDDYAEIGSSGEHVRITSTGDLAQIGSSGNFARITSSGERAQIGSSGLDTMICSNGYHVQIGSSGDRAYICSSGYDALISSEGHDAIIMCAGKGAQVRAKEGSWITLTEWKDNKLVCVKTERVDGVRIKADTWYHLKNGEFVEYNTANTKELIVCVK